MSDLQSAVNHEFLSQLDDYIKIKRYRLVNAVVVYENERLFSNDFIISLTNIPLITSALHGKAFYY